ncbi:hypothetical protein [Ornithinimicrobium kibberense]|uniref:hypothetical protein n=1 Tax=Ornithinimicrobium kibberense TaxID=282060 RepID=UPI00360BADB6
MAGCGGWDHDRGPRPGERHRTRAAGACGRACRLDHHDRPVGGGPRSRRGGRRARDRGGRAWPLRGLGHAARGALDPDGDHRPPRGALSRRPRGALSR